MEPSQPKKLDYFEQLEFIKNNPEFRFLSKSEVLGYACTGSYIFTDTGIDDDGYVFSVADKNDFAHVDPSEKLNVVLWRIK